MLGVYVVMPEPLPPVGETLRLKFSLPSDDRPIECSAQVAWQNVGSIFKGLGATAVGLPPGCGLTFVELAPEDRERIDARVKSTRPLG